MRRTLPLILILALALALIGCEVNLSVNLPTPAAPPVAPPADGVPPIEDYPPLPAGLPQAAVTRVIDGDTIVVNLDGREERVRLIGINTPETVDPRRPVECFGKEASANAKALLENQSVLLEDDPTQDSRDVNGRLLRYVWLADGRMANLEQVARGFAAEYTYAQPYRYRDVFQAAQRRAREAGEGLWSPATCGGDFTPVGDRPVGAAPAAEEPAPAASCPPAPEPRAAPNAPVRIVGVDKGGESVRLENVGPDPISLDGWVLCSIRGGESQRGVAGELAPGATLDLANPGEPIWSNSQRDDAALYDASGALVSYWEDR